MAGAPAIEIEGLGKVYDLGATHDKYRRFSEAIYDTVLWPVRRKQRQQRETGQHWALRDIDMTIGEGEVVGVIGHNGAGKSTLLKILSRVTEPTTGEARLSGRVGALLEVGTGFHGELSGRENIFLSGAIMGMTKRDIERRFDAIVEFAEVQRFLDTPVKRYSSGMYVRLAFAVAAHLEPEILLVDEVLAVGDAAFQRKCLGKMGEVASDGRTVLFVSHNMTTIQSLCERAYLLDGGRVIAEGSARKVVHDYLSVVGSTASVRLDDREDRRGDGSVRLTSLVVETVTGPPMLRVGSSLRFRIGYRSDAALRNVRFVLSVYDITRVGIFLLDSDVHGGLPEELPAEGELVVETGPAFVTPGRCYVNLSALRAGSLLDFVDNAATFDIEDDDPFGLGRMPQREWAVTVIDHTWTSSEAPAVGGDATVTLLPGGSGRAIS